MFYMFFNMLFMKEKHFVWASQGSSPQMGGDWLHLNAAGSPGHGPQQGSWQDDSSSVKSNDIRKTYGLYSNLNDKHLKIFKDMFIVYYFNTVKLS